MNEDTPKLSVIHGAGDEVHKAEMRSELLEIVDEFREQVVRGEVDCFVLVYLNADRHLARAREGATASLSESIGLLAIGQHALYQQAALEK